MRSLPQDMTKLSWSAAGFGLPPVITVFQPHFTGLCKGRMSASFLAGRLAAELSTTTTFSKTLTSHNLFGLARFKSLSFLSFLVVGASSNQSGRVVSGSSPFCERRASTTAAFSRNNIVVPNPPNPQQTHKPPGLAFVRVRFSSTSLSTADPMTTISEQSMELPQTPTPKPYPVLDLSDLAQGMELADERRQAAMQMSRKALVLMANLRSSFERGIQAKNDEKELEKFMREILNANIQSSTKEEEEGSGSMKMEEESSMEGATTATTDKKKQSLMAGERKLREGNLSARAEEYVRHRALRYFFETGRLLAPSTLRRNNGEDVLCITDEEYLGGACMGLLHDLARYGVSRATARDVSSVVLARNLVRDVNEVLMGFDFRNGPLRRKYDAIKYALKKLETILYELSVTGSTYDDEESTIRRASKKLRIKEGESAANAAGDDVDTASEEDISIVPRKELEELKLRMEHRDELRETLIKRCRDAQKAAKQCIYALHNGAMPRATKLLSTCRQCIIDDLLPIVQEEPMLRYGSFAAVIEEYVEAHLFYTWLVGDINIDAAKNREAIQDPSLRILLPSEFAPLLLEPEEYLGGLCDLTGEIGRFAVRCGTRRDSNAVRRCLETTSSILTSIQSLGRLPYGGSIGKKIDPLRRSVEKLEQMLYELSLVEATGGRNFIADSVNTKPMTDREEGDEDDDDL